MTTTAAQYADIQADMEARLSSSARIIPIIVVPGVFGTRLETTAGAAVWNPFGGFAGDDSGSLAIDVSQMRIIKNKLVPMERTVTEAELQAAYAEAAELHNEVQGPFLAQIPPRVTQVPSEEAQDQLGDTLVFANVKHAGNVIWSYYRDFILNACLDLPSKLNDATTTKTYCCGYDWRQSNRDSALHLAEVIEEALEECRAEKCVVVAHSMGGLVTRYYCRQLGGERRVAALFLAGSPTLGAIEPFVWLKYGVTDPMMRTAFGRDPFHMTRDTRDLVRTMPSSYELAANKMLCELVSPNFATFAGEHTAYAASGELTQGETFVDNSDWMSFYYDIYTGLTDDPITRGDVYKLMWGAYTFHQMLGAVDGKIYIPENTYSMYTTDVDTYASVSIPFAGVRYDPGTDSNVVDVGPITYELVPGGDGKVPIGSARPRDEHLVRPFAGVHPMSKVEHGNMLAQKPPYLYFKEKMQELVWGQKI